jgi:hypothetical protein
MGEILEFADRVRGGAGASNPVKDTLDTIRGVKELMGETKKSPTDDLATVVAAAKDLATMAKPADTKGGSDDWIRAELSAQRERSDKLMMLLIESKSGKSTDSLGVVKEVVGGLKDLLPEVKQFFPAPAEDGGRGTRMNGWQEFAVGMAQSLNLGSVLGPFAGLAASMLMNRFNGNAVPGHINPQPQPGHPAQPQPHTAAGIPGPTMMPFLQMVANPMMNYIRPLIQGDDPTEAGEAFASWVYDGFGADPRYGEAMLTAKGMGATGILATFRATPLWGDKGPTGMMPSLAELEPKLPAFFTAFLNYDPNAEPADSDDEEDDGQVPSLTYSEAAAGK